jgi:hypothetical protein
MISVTALSAPNRSMQQKPSGRIWIKRKLLGTVLFTELKGKAVQRYFMVDARNKVEAAINSLPNPGIRKPKSCSRKQKAP